MSVAESFTAFCISWAERGARLRPSFEPGRTNRLMQLTVGRQHPAARWSRHMKYAQVVIHSIVMAARLGKI